MFARLYMGIILSLSLLGGAIAAAPAAHWDHHAVIALAETVEPAVTGGVELPETSDANDNTPLLAEIAPAAALPQWDAAWKPSRAAVAVDTLLFLPDEPPRHTA